MEESRFVVDAVVDASSTTNFFHLTKVLAISLKFCGKSKLEPPRGA